jgi:glycosyltransferase involved in cell wall biosynthesis
LEDRGSNHNTHEIAILGETILSDGNGRVLRSRGTDPFTIPSRDILLVSSTFPPVIGGSAVVYDQLSRNASEKVAGLGPSRNYHTEEIYPHLAEVDAATPYFMHRVEYLRPVAPDAQKTLPARLWSILVDDLPLMVRTFSNVTALVRQYRSKIVCLGELVDLGWLVLPVRYILRRKVIIYTHGEEISETSNRLLGALRGLFLRHANAVVSVSHFCKDGIISRYGVHPSKIFVISNGVDLNRFSRSESDRAIIPANIRGRKIVLSVSRMVERKGLEFLISAAPSILQKVPDVHFVMIGSGPLANSLKRLAAAMGLSDRFSFMGEVSPESLVQYYQAADLFALPCRTMPNGDTEGFGLVFLEANACGLPVVAGAAGGTVEAVIDGETGLLVDGSDPAGIASAVVRILCDPKLAADLGEAGWRRAQAAGWPKITERFVDACSAVTRSAEPFRDVAPPSHNRAAEVVSEYPSVLQPAFPATVSFSANQRPLLLTTVDAEEDFDWSKPFSRTARDVSSMASQPLAHRIFDRYGVIPTYLLDFPVASQPAGFQPLLDYFRAGRCLVGTQLHPWVNPPFAEEINPSNSFTGNLPRDLEFEKLRILTETIENAFGLRPRIYRAGRYGVGANTGEALRRLGYRIDTSVVPQRSFTHETGPDFFGYPPDPWWIDAERTMLEIPITSAVVGPLHSVPKLSRWLFDPRKGRRILPAGLSRTGLLNRIKLTPEGVTDREAKMLIKELFARGTRVFVLSYHSPSLVPGRTPYVRTAADLERFLGWLDSIYEYFFGELGGMAATPLDVYKLLSGTEIEETPKESRSAKASFGLGY